MIGQFCSYNPVLWGKEEFTRNPESEGSHPAPGKVVVGLVTIAPPAGEDSRRHRHPHELQ